MTRRCGDPGEEPVSGQHEPRAEDAANAIIGYSEMLYEEAEDLGLDSFLPDLRRSATLASTC